MSKRILRYSGYFLIFINFYLVGLTVYNTFILLGGNWDATVFAYTISAIIGCELAFKLAFLLLIKAKNS